MTKKKKDQCPEEKPIPLVDEKADRPGLNGDWAISGESLAQILDLMFFQSAYLRGQSAFAQLLAREALPEFFAPGTEHLSHGI